MSIEKFKIKKLSLTLSLTRELVYFSHRLPTVRFDFSSKPKKKLEEKYQRSKMSGKKEPKAKNEKNEYNIKSHYITNLSYINIV